MKKQHDVAEVSWISNKFMKIFLFLLALAIFSFKTYAAPLNIDNFVGVFDTAGNFLEQLLSNDYAVFGITVFIFTMMLYNIFVPLIAKIPVFKGGGKGGLANKYGKVVSLCLAILSSLGIFGVIYLNGGANNVGDILDSVLGPYATLAGILMALLVFGIIYFGFKDCDPKNKKWLNGLWGAGLAMVFFGFLMSEPFMHSIGWFIVFIVMLMMFFGMMGGGEDSGDGKDSEKDSDSKKKKDSDDSDDDSDDGEDDGNGDGDDDFDGWEPEILQGDVNLVRGRIFER